MLIFVTISHMKKLPVCPICGGCHYQYACWKNPKRKSAFKAHFKAVERTKTKKMIKGTFTQKDARKDLIYKLDLIVSKYVRQYYADKNGVCTCYTCGRRLPWKGMDCSHFISRRFNGTRFDLDNLRACCQHCNRVLHGNLEKYREHLLRDIGEERIRALDRKKNQKISTPELEAMLEEYKDLLKNLKK